MAKYFPRGTSACDWKCILGRVCCRLRCALLLLGFALFCYTVMCFAILQRQKTEEISHVNTYKLTDEGSKITTKSANPERSKRKTDSVCRIPELNPFSSVVMQYIEDPGELNCGGPLLTNFYKNRLTTTVSNLCNESDVGIRYRVIRRQEGDDNAVLHGEWITALKKGRVDCKSFEVSVEEDFIELEIDAPAGTETEMHAHVWPKDDVIKREVSREGIVSPSGMPLNVMMIMFDSISHAQFQRKAPSVYRYLKRDLNSVILNGQTIVGDGTTAQLTAMFTGIAEVENQEARRSFPGTGPVDRWPFIFHDYQSHGYATLFSEDDAQTGTFNYRLTGFSDPPTDHYARPFWLASSAATENHCVRKQKVYLLQLDYIQSLYTSYPSKPKFSVTVNSELTHGSIDNLQMAEGDLLDFLKRLKRLGHLDNTMVVIFGDHGSRFDKFRETMHGKLEERLPFFSVTMPVWFREKYRDLFLNLWRNSKLLTSPFDTYATLAHIISYPKVPSGRKTGQSLFTKISERRTCAEAGVDLHWCPCLDIMEINSMNRKVQYIAQEVVSHINHITSTIPLFRKLCERLSLKEVIFAGILVGNKDVEQFMRSKDRHGRQPEFNDQLHFKDIETSASYELHFKTSPNNGSYEATVNLQDRNIRIVGDVSRVNRYGDQPKCVMDKYIHLRKFCYCKNDGLNG